MQHQDWNAKQNRPGRSRGGSETAVQQDSGVIAATTGEAEDAEEASRHEGVGGRLGDDARASD